MTPRTTGRLGSLLVLAAVVSHLLAPLATGVHLQVASHRVCAEHGSLEHIDSSAGLRTRQAGSEPLTNSLTSLAGDEEPSHAHRLCHVSPVTTTPAVGRARTDALEHASERCTVSPPAIERPHRSLATLDLAPKVSPPVDPSAPKMV
jgi:hypothetical protein